MAKIPFSIKYRPQIEAGEYKVELRDGRPVKIIYWEAKGPSPIIGLFIADDGYEATTQAHSNGRWSDNDSYESDYDLFIVTPEEELTEFENRLCEILDSAINYQIHSTPEETIKDAKKLAPELLAIAEKEITKGYEHEQLKQWEEGYDKGKSEALRGLPRWRTWGNGACGSGVGFPIALVYRYGEFRLVSSLGIGGEKYIMLNDIKELPGFKED